MLAATRLWGQVMKSIVMGALLVTSAPETPALPLAPTTPWTVEYADNLCVLSRDYISDKGKITFGVRPWPMGDSVELVLLQPTGYGVGIQTGKAKVTLLPSTVAITATYSSYATKKTKTRIATVNIPSTALGQLGSSTGIEIAIAGKPPVSFALVKMKAALGALTTCTDDLLRSWHIDPAEQLRIATPAQPIQDASYWISDDDYPADALSRESQGTVTIIWTIDTEGKVTNCSVAATSGDPALDSTACATITKRGRYKPALDKDGKPIAVHSTRRIVWRLP